MRVFCRHEWEFIREIAPYAEDDLGGDRLPYKRRRVYICKKCLKRREIKV